MHAATARFETFGTQHLIVLGVFVLGVVVALLAGRALRAGPEHRTTHVCRAVALVLLGVMVPLQLTEWAMDGFDLQKSLPIQICDLVWMVLAAALWTRSSFWLALSYFWGLTLSLQGVLTPDLHSGFPEARFFMFWALHLPVVWVAAFVTVGLRQGPGWREYRESLAATGLWAGAAMLLNWAIDANYGFLNALPRGGSVLDALGPWPWYVVWEAVILAVGWALITWPWVRRRARTAAPTP